MPLTDEQLVSLAMANDFDAPGRWVRMSEHRPGHGALVWLWDGVENLLWIDRWNDRSSDPHRNPTHWMTIEVPDPPREAA